MAQEHRVFLCASRHHVSCRGYHTAVMNLKHSVRCLNSELVHVWAEGGLGPGHSSLADGAVGHKGPVIGPSRPRTRHASDAPGPKPHPTSAKAFRVPGNRDETGRSWRFLLRALREGPSSVGFHCLGSEISGLALGTCRHAGKASTSLPPQNQSILAPPSRPKAPDTLLWSPSLSP